MNKNVELAYKTLDYIRAHPEEWSQQIYMCGSMACFAGRASLIALDMRHADQFRCRTAHASVPAFAREALGWTREEGDHVFGLFTKDFSVLERAVKEVLNGDVR